MFTIEKAFGQLDYLEDEIDFTKDLASDVYQKLKSRIIELKIHLRISSILRG